MERCFPSVGGRTSFMRHGLCGHETDGMSMGEPLRLCVRMSARMALAMSARMAVVLAIGVAVGGCADKRPEAEANAKKVAISSGTDATAEISDEHHRFKLTWPGTGWKLLHSADAERLMPRAAAALVSDKVVGVVLVSSAPALDAERYAALVAEQLDLDERRVLSNDEIQFEGQKARRIAVAGRAGGLALRYGGIVFIRGKLAYTLLAWGSAKQVPQDGSAFDTVFDAFSLTDGEAMGRATERAAVDAAGVGWHVKDGTFASAVSGLRVKAPEGARLLLGGELRALNADAEVGFVSRSPSMSMVVVSERDGGEPGALSERLTEDFKKQLKAVAPFPFEANWFGTKRSLTHYRSGQRSHVHGVHVQAGRVYQISAEYLVADSDEAQELIRECLSGMQLMVAADRKKLSGELVESARSFTEIGEHFATRGGVYRDFTRGIAWTLPKGLWRVRAGRDVKRINHDAALYMDNPELGLFALVIIDERGELKAASYHKRVVDSMGARVGFASFDDAKEKVSKLGDEKALLNEGTATVRGTQYQYRVVTSLRDDSAVQLLVWGRPGDFRASRAQVKAVQQGLRFDVGIKAIERTTAVYRNHRLGFEVNLPPVWRFEDLTRPELTPVGRFVRWETRGRWIGVLAVHLPDHGFEQGWLVDYLEQLLRDEYANIARGPREESEGSLAGASARHLSWSAPLQRVDAMLTVRGRVAYVVLAVDNGDEAFELATRNFGFVD
jgi:hypothetical protein